MAVYALGDRVPEIDPTAYVHPDAVVIGHVSLGPHASVWPSAVLRGDYGVITVGARTSIQDGTIIHATAAKATTVAAVRRTGRGGRGPRARWATPSVVPPTREASRELPTATPSTPPRASSASTGGAASTAGGELTR